MQMTYKERATVLSASIKSLADVLASVQQDLDITTEMYHDLEKRHEDARAKWKDEKHKNMVLRQEKEELSRRVEELLKRYEGGGK